MKKSFDLSLKIEGRAGEGVFTLNKLITNFSINLNNNLNTMSKNEYPSLIEGGKNKVFTRISENKFFDTKNENFDLQIFFNKDYFLESKTKSKLNLIFDNSLKNNFKVEKNNIYLNSHKPKNKNIFLFIVFVKNYLGITDEKLITNFLDNTFKNKIKDLEKDVNYFYKILKELKIESKNFIRINKNKKVSKKIYNGNQIAIKASLYSKIKLLAAYPITPVDNFLKDFSSIKNVETIQAEDELAAINMAIGGNMVGERSATATSGPGLSLMSEAIGFAAISETPVVIFVSSRVGPSTGMPTYTEQADLNLALNVSQGDFTKIILAPSDKKELFILTQEAFNLSEIYQTPVIILFDKFLSTTEFSLDDDFIKKNILEIKRGKLITKFSEYKNETNEKDFKRYELTKDSISFRPALGCKGCESIVTSYEHDEFGMASEDFKNRENMMKKRASKFKSFINNKKYLPKIYGEKKGVKFTFISFGSTKLQILEAIKVLKDKYKIKTNLIHFNVLEPLNKNEIKKILSKYKNLIIVENNFSSQFSNLITEKTGITIKKKLRKYNGLPFEHEEIVNYIIKNGKK